jgi:DNA-directed RNA polymerase specialized sigma24 family protein
VAWEGLTSTEAAEALGISKVAARSRLHRARHRALQALHGSHGSHGLSFVTTPVSQEETP